MLHMKDVSKVYRTEMVETHALRKLALEVNEGEFVAVTGPSGSGKTTFLNVAGLLDAFEQGHYWLDGADVSRLSDNQMSRIRNEKIGFIFQSFNLIPDLDVFDNVDVPLRYRGLRAKERKERIERAVSQVGLSSRLHHLPSQLSGGQQQRVAIARVLAGDPKLILADEPTGNLDSGMAREIMDILDGINQSGTSIIMVTHNPEHAARAHRQLHIADGRMVDIERLAPSPLTRPAGSPVSIITPATPATPVTA
jgi:putative ABC transport system ATP-binding protein